VGQGSRLASRPSGVHQDGPLHCLRKPGAYFSLELRVLGLPPSSPNPPANLTLPTPQYELAWNYNAMVFVLELPPKKIMEGSAVGEAGKGEERRTEAGTEAAAAGRVD
jgi:hypothetical protein